MWGGAIVALALGGCSAGADREAEGPTLPPPTGDISAHQAEVLALWEETGEVTFEDYRVAMYDALDCIETAGFTVGDVWETEVWGQRGIEFSTVLTAEELEAGRGPEEERVVAQCMSFHSSVIESLYAQNPAAIETADEYVKSLYPIFGPDVVACLVSNGVTVTDPEDADEWFSLAADLMLSDDGNGPDCLEEAGWWDATMRLGEP